MSGTLYVVATPIGNLADFSARARAVLSQVDLIAAEDTRHSRKLLDHFGITTTMTAFHEHNEREKAATLLQTLREGRSIALITDAGTPLVSDPGYGLVRQAHAAQIPVVPIPGPCAAITALSAAGLPSDRFAFEGFPPAKETARRGFFEDRRGESRTLIFYETPHRITDSLRDMAATFGADREAAFARELTKQFETIRTGTLGDLAAWVAGDLNQQRGEIVVLVRGAVPDEAALDTQSERVLRLLLAELPVKQAAHLAAEITGRKRNLLYQRALTLTKGE